MGGGLMPEVNTANDAFWGSNGESIAPIVPAVFYSRQAAWRAAAWLVVMAIVLDEEPDQEGVTFEQILEAIKET